MGLINCFKEATNSVKNNVKNNFTSIGSEKLEEKEQMMRDNSALSASGKQNASEKASGKIPPNALTFAKHTAKHSSLYQEFERAFMANMAVQTYLDYPLYEAYSRPFSELCEPLLKFVGFWHYGGDWDDDVWQSGLQDAVEDLKRALEQVLPQVDDKRKKRELELKLELSRECTQLLLDFIPYSYSCFPDLAAFHINWDNEKVCRLDEMMRPGRNKGDSFKAWKEDLRLQIPLFSGKEMEETYQELRGVAEGLCSGKISPDRYADCGKFIVERLTKKDQNIGVRLGFFEDEAVQGSKMRLHFYDSQLKCPGLFTKDYGRCWIKGKYPRSSE